MVEKTGKMEETGEEMERQETATDEKERGDERGSTRGTRLEMDLERSSQCLVWRI